MVSRAAVNWLASIVVVIAALALLSALAFWKYRQIQQAASMPPPPESPTAVSLAQVSMVTYRNATTSIGTVVAPQWIAISNELPGTVSFIREGNNQPIEPGELLLKLDTSVEEAQLAGARARLKIAESVWRRTSQMAETRAVTELELEESESQWQQAQAQVAELEATIGRKSFHAPFRGQLGIVDTHVGQYLPAGSTVTLLQSLDDFLLVDFMLPQSVAASVGVESEVSIAHHRSTWPARIVAKDAQADRQTRNVRYRARMEQPPDTLLPGDSVNVAIEYGPTISLPAVPSVAVRYSPQGAFVFIAERTAAGELRAQMRPVIPAAAVGSDVGLAQGAAVGDVVVAEGSFKLHDGALLADMTARFGPNGAPVEPNVEQVHGEKGN